MYARNGISAIPWFLGPFSGTVLRARAKVLTCPRVAGKVRTFALARSTVPENGPENHEIAEMQFRAYF